MRKAGRDKGALNAAFSRDKEHRIKTLLPEAIPMLLPLAGVLGDPNELWCARHLAGCVGGAQVRGNR